MKQMSIAMADSILARFPDPDDIPYRRWCYVQGYVMCGLERLWTYTGDSKYFDYIKKFVDQHVTPNGDVLDFKGDSLDDMMAGTTFAMMYEHTGEEKYRLAAYKVRAKFNDYPRNSDGAFWHGRSLPHELWIDGVFMGGMFLLRYGVAVGDQASLDEAVRQILLAADNCRKGDTGLFLHAYDEAKKVVWADPQTGLSPEVWSEGQGWVALILIEALERLPATQRDRAQVMTIFQDLCEGLRQTQDPTTGLWYQVVDKGDREDNWHDTSGSAMFVYAIQRGIDLNFISAEKYEPVVQNGYRGITSKAVINEQGLVDVYDACDGLCVQQSYEDYINYPKVVNAKEAVGSFLWATIIVEKPQS
jgi:rhamnogalacturonyl hydrolase YesR